ncbi:MAG: sigma-70 family RNA polymerase sigma factor, partial [Ardenticatenales bacterium]
AEDATADAFARAWAARAAYDPSRGDASAWLWAIARNAVTDRLRRRAHAPFALSASVAASVAATGGEHDVHGAAAARIDWQRLVAAVAALPDLDHDIVALRIGAGLGHDAVGAAVGLSAGAVAQRFHRILGRLQRAVDGADEEVRR